MEVPQFDKFIEGPVSGREGAQEWLGRRLLEEGGKAIEGLELEKSARDVEIIALCDEAVSMYMKRYGRKKEIGLPLQNVHALEDGGVERYTHGRFVEGAHAPTLGSVIVDRKKSDVEFAVRVFHELFHAKSYQALQIIGNEVAEPYRSGFTVVSRDGKKSWFVDLEEAVVGMMTERFFKEIVNEDSAFRNEIEAAPDGPYLGREKEVTRLNLLVDELWEKNREEFKSREEIVKVFVDAQINGRLLRVARLVERTFGKGSFRRLGEADELIEKSS